MRVLSNIKRFVLFIILMASVILYSSSSIIHVDSLKQAAIKEDSAKEKAIDALNKLQKYYSQKEKNNKTNNKPGQQSNDSMNYLVKLHDSLKLDSLRQRAIIERKNKVHKIEKSLKEFSNPGFTIYDGIIYFTLFAILLFVFLYFRRLLKNKKMSFKEFYILWKKSFKELRDKEKEKEQQQKKEDKTSKK
jgi:hypothetical protein